MKSVENVIEKLQNNIKRAEKDIEELGRDDHVGICTELDGYISGVKEAIGLLEKMLQLSNEVDK